MANAAAAVKRFYKAVAVGDGGTILLDGRPVKTPARRALALPSDRLAREIGAEWSAQGDDIDPRAMRLTGLANAAIDHAATDPEGFAGRLAAYGESDLLCYRAAHPDTLVGRQAAEWDPPLAWARSRYGLRFAVTEGIVHVPQPPETIARLAAAIPAHDPFALAALSPLVTVSGSLVLALAVAEGALGAEAAFAAALLDELWQAEHWGEDALGAQSRAARRADFMAAARFLALLEV